MWMWLVFACGVENDLRTSGGVGPAPDSPDTDVEATGDTDTGELPIDSGSDSAVDETDAPDTDPADTGTPADTDDTAIPVDTGDTDEPDVPTGLPCDTSVTAADVSYCTAGVAAILNASDTYATVASAVSAASPGDVVTVCPGTWTESFAVGKELSIVGYGSSSSVLSGGGTSRILQITGGPVLLMDLGFTDGEVAGYGDSGGAIEAYGGDLCLVNDAFTDNYASYDGGGVAFYGGTTLAVSGTTFSGNYAGYEGGGLRVGGGATVTVDGSTFEDNVGDGGGGGMEGDWDCTLAVTDTTFAANYAGYEGGGLGMNGWAPGGGVTLERVVFDGNEADYGGGGFSGNGWDFYDLTVIDSEFTGNRAGYEAGAIGLNSWGGVDLYAENTTFTDNAAAMATGGALDLGGWGAQTAELVDCTFEGNMAPSGGALGGANRGTADFVVTGGSVIGNIAGSSGGGAALDSDSTLTVTGSDWGTGATDNVPSDVRAGTGYSGYGAGVSFTCSAGVCI